MRVETNEGTAAVYNQLPRNYSAETYTVLRNCRLLDQGTLDGVTFVRCIPRPESYGGCGDGWEISSAQRSAMARRVVADVNDPGVVVANNPDFGGDYVRVATDTQAYRLICHMKS